MSLKKFKSDSRELVLLQENVDRALSQIQVLPMVNGNLLAGVILAVGDNVINHKLGRKLRGYVVVSQSAVADMYDNISTGSELEQNFTLNSSAICTVNIWVF